MFFGNNGSTLDKRKKKSYTTAALTLAGAMVFGSDSSQCGNFYIRAGQQYASRAFDICKRQG